MKSVPLGALFLVIIMKRGVFMRLSPMYRNMLKGVPDVLNVKQVGQVLSVSTKTVYKHIGDGSLHSIKVGREFRIPKVSLIDYLRGASE